VKRTDYLRCSKNVPSYYLSTSAPIQRGPAERIDNDTDERTPFYPKLKQVPSIPFLGSMIFFDRTSPYKFWLNISKEYGDFFTIGLPGMGKGLHGTTYVIADPKEMLKVLHNEGTYPSGAIQAHWPTKKWLKEIDSPLGGGDDVGEEDGYWGDGPKWRRLRSFLQTDLLTPKIAKGYVPGMIRAAEYASAGASKFSGPNRFPIFSARASFDMFTSVTFGEFSRVANPKTEGSSDDKDFCKYALDASENLIPLLLQPKQILCNLLGITTEQYKQFSGNWKMARNIGLKKSHEFMAKASSGELGEFQQRSYMANAIKRKNEGGDVSVEELADLNFLILSASLDTTSSLLNWLVVHLSLNPNVQERLHAELTSKMEDLGETKLVPEMFYSPSTLPFLQSVLRESHRCTPAIPVSLLKKNKSSDIEIHGETIPRDSTIILDAFSLGHDPRYVDDPDLFLPERWLNDAVGERKGTWKEILDHKLYQKPFSAGARQCPASRVAYLEVLTMISQLILDWEINLENSGHIKSFKDVDYFQGTTVQPIMPALSFTARS